MPDLPPYYILDPRRLLPASAAADWLGRIVVDFRDPHAAFTPDHPQRFTEGLVVEDGAKDVQADISRSRSAAVSGALSELVSVSNGRGQSAGFSFQTGDMHIIRLSKYRDVFLTMREDPEVREYLARVLKPGGAAAYMIVGLLVWTEASLSVDREHSWRHGVEAQIPALGIASAVAGIPLPIEIGDPAVGVSSSNTARTRLAMSFPGSRIFAIEYKAVRRKAYAVWRNPKADWDGRGPRGAGDQSFGTHEADFDETEEDPFGTEGDVDGKNGQGHLDLEMDGDHCVWYDTLGDLEMVEKELPGPANGGAIAEAHPSDHTIKPPEHVDALRRAILNGRHTQALQILQDHPGLVNEPISSGGTVLHYAIRTASNNNRTERDCLELFNLLKDLGDVDWNAQDRSRRTPLHLACTNTRSYSQVADFLLYHKADPNLLDEDDCSPLHEAATDGHKEMVTILLAYSQTKAATPAGDGLRTALHKAAYRGHLEIATLLVDHDSDTVDARDVDGHTPLHDASRQNKPEMALMLIEANADVNAKTKRGATPLHVAAASNALKAAKELLRADAWTFAVNNARETPEMVAERKGHTAILGLLRAAPINIDSNLGGGGGQVLKVSPPTEAQRAVAKEFDGFIWPSIDGHSKYDQASVFDMLYADEPKLKKSRKDKDVRWIHIPSNNRAWIEDVFKVVYSSEESGHGRGKAKAQDLRSPEQAEFSTPLKDFLRFINGQFNGFDPLCLHQQPHFEVSYGHRPELAKFRIYSLVFPVLDADMQQPVYFDPNPDPPPVTRPASKADTEMDANQKARVDKLDALAAAYPDTLNKCRTLDGYIHEFIDEVDLNFRNGDQVVSRYVERTGSDTWKSKRLPGIPEPVLERVKEEPRARRRKRRISVTTAANGDDNHGSRNLKPSVSDVVTGRARTELSQLASKREHSLVPDFPKGKDEYAKVLDSDDDQDNDPDPVQKCVRQQILTVPQIWLWAVESTSHIPNPKLNTSRADQRLPVTDTVVTAYPEGWRLAPDRDTLPQSIMQALRGRLSPNKNAGKTTVDGLIQDIVMAALEFEPSISTISSNRSYLDAFANEVSFASSRVTKCYESFKSNLGTTITQFPDAIKQETELLVRVDDIVNEISMIRRVQQDQDHVCILLRIAAHQMQRGQSKKGAVAAGNAAKGGAGTPRRDGRIAANARHELAVERGVNDLRSPKSQHVLARLQRLEEDARRVRKSIITLLDLRQRQATTENAISSGRQSALLFAQSKVLFVFTAATVIFAPLSWVSSLMALNIESFSPGKDNDWPWQGVFGASFSSVVCTLLLCVMGWAAYDWRVKKRDQKAETKEKEEREKKQTM
ncbi:hypothetical protein C8A05DRAFT_36634 [Staphylotrichum tortipilum]|uniref:Ankyrin repeat protein n=1 Tax=Staphylotrichum tortipilum TaxID=2831512 RepID=A0AAN6MFT0_9PEZI|nr:hypothetical protein C8A05DRAFT_36634 [Staphylotrichum longicolle]